VGFPLQSGLFFKSVATNNGQISIFIAMQNHLTKYNQNFLSALEKLNENQLKAVNQTEGPVLVIAGPGTGKTQILAARIGNILLKTDTLAHNILCLTYTDAGAVAMRKRLFEFIGPEAYRVNIYTFHAFCNDIIQENLDYFGKLELEAISDLERMELFRKLVDSFGSNHPLKRFRGDVYYEVSRLQNLFSVMKREDWSAAFIQKKITEFIEMISTCDEGSEYYSIYKYTKKYKDKQAGDFKPTFTTMVENMEKLQAAVLEFPKYQELMKHANRYDFDDMIIWVLEAFKDDDQFLINYQERFQYILVDEYQDTSGSQNELINFLISYWDQPNIFVVGDDDQSIFRFQGANIQNIEAYNLQYAQYLYRVMLTDNYRSTQSILDISRILISNNRERIQLPGLSKHLIAKNEALLNLSITPEINAYPTQFHEFAAITHEIENLIKEGTPAEEIAIIYKEHKSGEELARYFKIKGLPINTKRKVNILSEPFGKKIINIFTISLKI
jgi:DNA helicase-2/ATP-dependent DNA helicase PcrA